MIMAKVVEILLAKAIDQAPTHTHTLETKQNAAHGVMNIRIFVP